MPSPITTEGFRLSVMPQIQFADPRLLGGNLGSVIPGIASGMEFADQIQQRPIKRQLADLQLQEAQAKIAALPLERQLRLAQIAEAEQNAAVPREVIDGTRALDMTQVFPTALDDQGNRTGPDEKIIGDLYQIETGTRYGANGVATPFERKKLVKDAAARELEIRKQDELDAYRTSMADAAQDRARAAQATAEAANLRAQLAQQKLDNPGYKKLGYGVSAEGNMVYHLQNPKTGEIEYVDTGMKPKQSEIEQLMNMMRGGSSATTSAPANIVQKSNGTATPYKTLEEAENAINSGLHKPGDKIIVGTKSFTVQE